MLDQLPLLAVDPDPPSGVPSRAAVVEASYRHLRDGYYEFAGPLCPWGPCLPAHYRGAVVSDEGGYPTGPVVCVLPDGTRLTHDGLHEDRDLAVDDVTGELLEWYRAPDGRQAFWQPVGWPVGDHGRL